MHIPPFRIRPASLSLLNTRSTFPFASRTYATHRNPLPSSLLSQSLDRTSRGNRSVGPFPLGISQPYVDHGEKVKKWSELSAGGKIARTTARTTNLAVILFGAGLSAVLVYALTTELFSKNSPTVLHNKACDKIKVSPEVSRYLQGPLLFHNNPPSAVRPRHRNRHVSAHTFRDPSGHEHMLLNFYVRGSPPGLSSLSSESSYLDSLIEWTQMNAKALSQLTLDECIEWMNECAADMRATSKQLFRYLSGTPLPPPPLHTTPRPRESEVSEKNEGNPWSFAGLFSGLRGPKTGRPDPPVDSGQVWTEGEVHAELIMNNQGYFTFERIYIDMPDSQARNRKRIFVERY